MNPTEPPKFAATSPAPSDPMLLGCGLGCACQALCFAVSLVALGMSQGKLGNLLFVSWGLTQWVGILPMYLRYKRESRPRTAQGLLIYGCLGVLLSSACAAMVFR